jgi:hypothetical protein
MKTHAATLFIAIVSIFALAGMAEAKTYSKVVTQSCKADYKKHCSEFGLETAALRNCMDRNGQKLSKGCVNALVKAGEISQAEVNRRRKSGR